MNLIKKLTGIFLIILYTLRIKKKPTQKVDNTDLNQLLEKAIVAKPKDEDQELVDAVIKDYQSGQSETDYLLSNDANKERLLESVASIRDRVQAERDDKIATATAEIKEKVEARQETIEAKVEETKKNFNQGKCASIIAKVAEKVFNESPTKVNGFQSIGVDRNKRAVDNLKEKQAKGKKLNRKERNKIALYNKQNNISSNDTAIQQQNMINNVILISALDDNDTTLKVDSVELPKSVESEPYTGTGGKFGGGGASSSWTTEPPIEQPKPVVKQETSSYTQSSAYSHSRNDDYDYTPPTKSYSSSSSSSSSRSDDSSSYSSSYDSGSSYSSSDSSSSSSSSDW